MSGADLEYQAMLTRAGAVQSDKLDGARLEQVGDKRQADGTWGQGGGGGGGGATLPVGGTTGQVLKKNSNVNNDASWANKVLDSAHADNADNALLASQAQILSVPRNINGVPFNGSVDITVPANVDLTGYMQKSSPLTAFTQVSDVAPVGGQSLVWDSDNSVYVPVDRTAGVALVDGTGRLSESNWPKYFLPFVVVDPGAQAPSDFPLGGVVLERPAPLTLVPLVAGKGLLNTNGATLVITLTSAIPAGGAFEINLMTSAETTSGTLPTTVSSVTPSAGGLSVTGSTPSYQSGTVQVDKVFGRATTTIPIGATITITLNQSRVHRAAIIANMPNLVATGSLLDKNVINSGGSSGTLDLAVGPTTTLTQASELATMTIGHNDSTVETRVVGGTNGWLILDSIESDNGGSSRTLTVLYKVLSSTAAVTGTFHITASDATSGAWAGSLATYKAA